MPFASIEYLIFLPITFLLFWVLPKKIRWIVLLAASCFFYMFYNDLTIANSMSVMAISIFSFVVFVRVCLKFDIYRLFLVIVCAILCTAIFVVDFLLNLQFLEINYRALQVSHWLTLLLVMVIAIILYFGLSLLASKFHKYLDKRREEKKNDRFRGSKESISE